MHPSSFSEQFQAFENTKSRYETNQRQPFIGGENKASFPIFDDPSPNEVPEHIKMIFDQQPDDDPSRRKNQEAFQPTGFSNYEQQDPSKNLQDQTEIKIPSFSQVFGGVMANNLSNVERTGHSTPGDVASPSNRINPKTGKKYSNSPRVYNVQINEDINLIERIENLLTTISENYNRYCPGCQGYIELKKSNFQNISAYFSRSKQRYYVVHFNCYLKSSSASSTKIRGLSDTPPGRCIQIQGPGLLEMSNYLRSDRRTYLITVEGYHPLNSQLFFRIDKTCFALEHANQGDQLLYLNLTSKSTSIFEPNLFLIPYNEFRCVVTIYLTQSLDEPYQLEFMADASEFKLNSETKTRHLEVIYVMQTFQAQ